MTSRPCDAAGCHAPSVIWRRDGTALCGRHLDAALFLKETDDDEPRDPEPRTVTAMGIRGAQ